MMSKKSAPKYHYTIPPFILALIFVQCLVTLYVVINQQTLIEHQALIEKIQIMQEKGLKVCINTMQNVIH